MKKNMNSKIYFLLSNVRSTICGLINCLDSDEIVRLFREIHKNEK